MSSPPSVTVLVDSHLLLHAVDDLDPAKRDQARAWIAACWTRRCGRVSTQVLNEFYFHARKKFSSANAAGDARAVVRRYQHWKPWAADQATVETAWAIESRYGLGYWDALIVASAQHQGCRYVLSEDMPQDQLIDGVMIVNPFLVGPELLDAPAPAWAKDLA
ncbi:MAG TPA: PIN domain-containing protein [Ideonella sp.]|uniref:PIN domain-containing protein n=1 Tax=Ideonella sp. TaxID=1929293 RepID=UPI002C940974|nr:PIN domain-containing protein [Ideonella sp.]HSI48968.1 PIN domain-containing protein [Ideonella sp.]